MNVFDIDGTDMMQQIYSNSSVVSGKDLKSPFAEEQYENYIILSLHCIYALSAAEKRTYACGLLSPQYAHARFVVSSSFHGLHVVPCKLT